MLRNLRTFIEYINYRLTSKTRFDIHSPFLFDWIEHTIHAKSKFYCFDEIEKKRALLLNEKREISWIELGAGSKKNRGNKRRLDELAKNSLMPAKYAQLLFRMAHYHQPEKIIELGTSLGITTSYLAKAISPRKVISIEGNPDVVKEAKSIFQSLQINNIEVKEGNIDEVFPDLLEKGVDNTMILVDGNHRKAPTLNYFKWISEKAGNNTIIIFDDIRWSDEMKEAWEEIRNDEKVGLSLDLFFIGIVFFRKDAPKQHFVIKY